MKKETAIESLKAIRHRIENGDLRTDLSKRRTILGQASALLSFNPMLQTDAIQASDILAQPNYSSELYERMEGRLDFLLSQGICELELGIKPEWRLVKGLVRCPGAGDLGGFCGIEIRR